MDNVNLEALYREYLLDLMKGDFDDFIETEVFSFEEFKKQLNQDKTKEI